MEYLLVMVYFNHESPLRGETFVTRKITRAVARIIHKKEQYLYLGNLDSKRDWGHARDYVKMMWMILQYNKPEDWVISTGKTTTVREFIKIVFNSVGIEIDFKGTGINEIGYLSDNKGKYPLKKGVEVVKIDPKYFRPTEVDVLVGDSTKAEKKLGWKAETSLVDMINEMIENDIEIVKKEIG